MRPSYALPAGKWPYGIVPTPQRLRLLDQLSSEMINGDEGGTWNPSAPLSFGIAVAQQLLLNNSGSQITGDIETIPGNSRGRGLEDTGLILTGADVGPVFQNPATRLVKVHFDSFIEGEFGAPGLLPQYVFHPQYLGAQSVQNFGFVLTIPLPFRASHANARLASAAFRYVVAQKRTVLPTNFAKIRIIKITGDTVATMHTNAGGYDADGYLPDTAADVAAYWNNGQPRVLTYTPNQNHTALDPAASTYALEIVDEFTASFVSLNVFLSAVLTLDSIADMRPE